MSGTHPGAAAGSTPPPHGVTAPHGGADPVGDGAGLSVAADGTGPPPHDGTSAASQDGAGPPRGGRTADPANPPTSHPPNHDTGPPPHIGTSTASQDGAGPPPGGAGEGTPEAYFAAQYARAGDPWGLAGRWYEQRKYDLTVASLPWRRYRRAFEPACSVGELTRRLAERCDTVLACDRVPAAVERARARTAGTGHVTVHRMTVPEEWPAGTFDLIVLSEFLYYVGPQPLGLLLERAVGALRPGGTLVTVHWDRPVPEHLYTGSVLAERVAAEPGLALVSDHREDDFVLQVFGRTGADGRPPPSPAAAEGLV